MAIASNTTQGTIVLTSDLHGSADPYNPELTPTGVRLGSYQAPSLVVDVKGRILYADDYEGTVNDATTSSKGVVQISTGLEVAAGVLSVQIGESASLGIVKSGDVNHITITAGDIDTGPNIADITTQNTFTKARAVTPVTGISTPDGTSSNFFDYTLTGNITINDISNPAIGSTYTFIFRQDGVGGHIVTFGGNYKIRSSASAVSSGANDVSILTCYVNSATSFLCILQNNFV